MLLLLVAALMLHATGALPEPRDVAISRFIKSRDGQGLLCLYAFDRFRPGVNLSADGTNETDDGGVGRLIPPSFGNLHGDACPFGDLQFDPTLVSSPGDDVLPAQLGVHLARDPSGDAKRPHIASSEVLPAREFMTTVLAPSTGMTFEFVFRRRLQVNESMTIFSIGNWFGDCADLGLRLEITATNQLMFMFHVPVLRDGYVGCHERRFYSTGEEKECLVPVYRKQVEDNPVVHATITVEPYNATVGFFLTYVDPVTMERHQCVRVQSKNPLEDKVFCDHVQGTHRLFIGNNPHNVTHPKNRSRIAMPRLYRDPFDENLSPEDQLRALIWSRLDAIKGPRLQASMRMYGGETFSFRVFGVQSAALSEDTPFSLIRFAINQFKKSYGEDIVEFIIKNLKDGELQKQQNQKLDDVPEDLDPDQNKSQSRQLYPDSNGSAFDLFHFAVYNKSLTPDTIMQHNWKHWITPFRPFLEETIEVHTLQDHPVELDLLQLHSIYNDIRLEVVELPEFGSLQSSSNGVKMDHKALDAFRVLPVDDQQKIVFVPEPGQNNKNLPKRDRFDFKRTIDPYAVIRFKVWNTTTGRQFNTSQEGRIEIFVDPVDLAPLLPVQEITFNMRQDAQVLLLSGVTAAEEDTSNKRRFLASSLDALGKLSSLDFGNPKSIPVKGDEVVEAPSQSLRILQHPRYGRLYDSSLDSHVVFHESVRYEDSAEFESLRIQPEWIHNRTFSTKLGYVRSPQPSLDGKLPVVDVMTYQIRQGSSGAFSKVGTIRFQVSSDADVGDLVVSTVRVNDSSAKVIELPQVEPLAGLLSSSASYKVKSLPGHGHIYQFVDAEDTLNDRSIGLPIRSGDNIQDQRGRLMYVPPMQSLHAVHGSSSPREAFSVELVVENVTAMKLSGALHDMKQPRTIQIQDNRSQRTKMSILPPTIVTTNAKRGKSVLVPVTFEDPDYDNATYRVTLKAKDFGTKFELEQPVTDDIILEYCGFSRPCSVAQNSDGSFASINASQDLASNTSIRFTVKDRNWDSARIVMEGSKQALLAILSRLKFIDQSLGGWSNEHSARFEVEIERLGSGDDTATKMMFYVDYAAKESDDDDEDSIGSTFSNFIDMLSVAAWVAVLCFLLSSASCCSMGSCCCCCARARDEKRREFEGERRRYMEQVVQNDGEYSTMLMGLVDVLLEPSLQLPTTLLRVLEERTDSLGLQVLTIFSLVPLLESEQQGIRFILHLLSHEDPANRIRSCVSTTIGVYCRQQGLKWLQATLAAIAWHDIDHEDDAVRVLLDAVDKNLQNLPPELVVLSRAGAKMLARAAKTSAFSEINCVRCIVFNHFILPALWFPTYGVKINRLQRQLMRKAAQNLVQIDKGEDDDSSLRVRCQRLLKTILTSPLLPDSLDRFNSTHDTDADLMAMCLMNLHSILEHAMPLIDIDGSCDGGDDDTTLTRVRLLLRALNFPIASADVLVASFQVARASDDMLWADLRIEAWQERVASSTRGAPAPKPTSQQPPRLLNATSLLSLSLSDEERSTTAAFESAASTEVLDPLEFEF